MFKWKERIEGYIDKRLNQKFGTVKGRMTALEKRVEQEIDVLRHHYRKTTDKVSEIKKVPSTRSFVIKVGRLRDEMNSQQAQIIKLAERLGFEIYDESSTPFSTTQNRIKVKRRSTHPKSKTP